MPIHWGVDSSYNHADRIINFRTGRPVRPPKHGEPQGDDEETLYDYVTRRMGQEPEFWGRYLHSGLSLAGRLGTTCGSILLELAPQMVFKRKS